jgi:hypothetical protein
MRSFLSFFDRVFARFQRFPLGRVLGTIATILIVVALASLLVLIANSHAQAGGTTVSATATSLRQFAQVADAGSTPTDTPSATDTPLATATPGAGALPTATADPLQPTATPDPLQPTNTPNPSPTATNIPPVPTATPLPPVTASFSCESAAVGGGNLGTYTGSVCLIAPVGASVNVDISYCGNGITITTLAGITMPGSGEYDDAWAFTPSCTAPFQVSMTARGQTVNGNPIIGTSTFTVNS